MLEEQENNSQQENEVTERLPRLYSKSAILGFSVFFSTIFGTVLLMSNMRSVEERKGRWQVLIFGILYTIGLGFTIEYTGGKTNYSIPLNILGGLILNEYFWNRYIGSGLTYEKKRWIKPAIISLLISIPFVVLALYMAEI